MSPHIPAEHIAAAMLWEQLCGACDDWPSASMAAGVALAVAERHPELAARLRRFLEWGGTAGEDDRVAAKLAELLGGAR